MTRPGLSPLLGSVVRLTAGTLAHSATAWLREFDSGPHRRFPWAQPEFREWACLSVGLPPPTSAALADCGLTCPCNLRVSRTRRGTMPRPASSTASLLSTAAKGPRTFSAALWKEAWSIAQGPAVTNLNLNPGALPSPASVFPTADT